LKTEVRDYHKIGSNLFLSRIFHVLLWKDLTYCYISILKVLLT